MEVVYEEIGHNGKPIGTRIYNLSNGATAVVLSGVPKYSVTLGIRIARPCCDN